MQRLEIAQPAPVDDGVAAGFVAKVGVRPAGIVVARRLVIDELAEDQADFLVDAKSARAPSAPVLAGFEAA